MRFSLISAIAVLSTSVLANLPSTCTLNEMYPEPGHWGVTYTCRWMVCGQNNAWREVRHCGQGNSCKVGSPTTCLDHVGNPF